jgi:transposase
VTLVYRQRRLVCRSCGIRTERIEFADPKARVTRRLRQQIGVDCQSMPTSHAAVRHEVSWGKARRAAEIVRADVVEPSAGVTAKGVNDPEISLARRGGVAASDELVVQTLQ